MQTGKNKEIKSTNKKDDGLRKHLGGVHRMTEYYYPSQAYPKSKKNEKKLTADRKKELDEAHLNAIYDDSRAFNDFNRPGQFFICITSV